MVWKIMMVDDEIDQLFSTKTSIEEHYKDEYQIIPISSGKECFDYLKNNPEPDLILLDIMMPGMSGWEVQRKLKEHGKWRNIPIVFLTARVDDFSQKIGSTLSADYLIKPVSVHDLKNSLDRVLHDKNVNKVSLIDEQKDSLQEIANIGASHAATVLSKIVHKYIQIGIPYIDIQPLDKIVNTLNREVSFGIYIKISIEIPTYCLLLLTEKDAYSLINILFDEEPREKDEFLSDMYQSALQEIGNIMMCSFLDSIAELLNISVTPSPPYIAYDDPAAIIDYILIELGKKSNEIISFNIDLKSNEDDTFDIKMLLLPEPKTIDHILEKLSMIQ